MSDENNSNENSEVERNAEEQLEIGGQRYAIHDDELLELYSLRKQNKKLRVRLHRSLSFWRFLRSLVERTSLGASLLRLQRYAQWMTLRLKERQWSRVKDGLVNEGPIVAQDFLFNYSRYEVRRTVLSFLGAAIAGVIGTSVLIWQGCILTRHAEEFALQRQVASDIHIYAVAEEVELIASSNESEMMMDILTDERVKGSVRYQNNSWSEHGDSSLFLYLVNLAPNPATNIELEFLSVDSPPGGGQGSVPVLGVSGLQRYDFLLPLSSASVSATESGVMRVNRVPENATAVSLHLVWKSALIVQVLEKADCIYPKLYKDDTPNDLKLTVEADDREGRRYRFSFKLTFLIESLGLEPKDIADAAIVSAAKSRRHRFRVRPKVELLERRLLVEGEN